MTDALSLLPAGIAAQNVPDGILLGPDSESRRWVGQVARLADRPHEVLNKVWTGDRTVAGRSPRSNAPRHGAPVFPDDTLGQGRRHITERNGG